jgi:hypothetical protein
MATTYKLFQSGTADGTVYIDLPISGRILSVNYSMHLAAGAGGIGVAHVELSRQATNQAIITNPRGVITGAYVTSAAASQGAACNVTFFPNEPVKSGERLYLNAAGSAANVTTLLACLWITIG